MNKPRPYKVSLTKGEILNALSNSVSFKDASIYLKISPSLLRFHCIHYDKDGDLRDYYKLKYNRKGRQGKSPKKLTREKILEALNATRSNLAAARYLGMDVRTLRKHAKNMLDDDGNPILDLNKNHSAVGIPKFGLRKGTRLDIQDLKDGKISWTSVPAHIVKYKLIEAGYLKEECNRCGFHERRAIDYKIPLILNFKDSNKYNYDPDNMEMLCYNCFYLIKGEIFTNKEILAIENTLPTQVNLDKVDEEIFELDPYHIRRLKELNLWDGEDPQDENPEEKLISRR